MNVQDALSCCIPKPSTREKRMVHIAQNIEEECELLFVHDNGARPYMVVVDHSTNMIVVLKKSDFDADDELEDSYDLTVFEISYTKVFIPEGSNEDERSNTVLINTHDDEYMIIGGEISKFTLNEDVVKFESPVGNNDVPYPYIITNNHIHLLAFWQTIKRNSIPIDQLQDPSGYFVNNMIENDGVNLHYETIY